MDETRDWDRARSEMPWYEVIASYDERFFSEELDGLVWETYSLGGFENDFPRDLESQLIRAFPDWANVPEKLPPDVIPRLREIRDAAEVRARTRGWHPEPRLAVIRETVRRRYA